MQEMAEMFKALSDETRVQILASLLLHGELCVCDVEGALGITQSKSSRHLRYLLHAGLVQKRREGVWMHYRIARKPDARRKVLFRMVRQMLTDEQWSKIEPLIPKRPKNPKEGRPPADDRLVFEGILWMLKTGARCEDLPDRDWRPLADLLAERLQEVAN